MGHASLLIETCGISLLVDPMLSMRAFGVQRADPPPVNIADIALSDVVLYTHAHYDHLDIPTLEGLRDDIRVILPWNTKDLAIKAGKYRVVELRPWEHIRIGAIKITAAPGKHWGARNIYDMWRGYLGYVIECGEGSVYIAGDTGYGGHFKEIALGFDIDVAVLPIGAYKPFWFRINHMSPKDAIKAFYDLKARIMIPVHWGAFRLSMEGINTPIKDLLSIITDDFPVKILQPGDVIEYSRGKVQD
ncbi:MAG: MBL fold metallo-hydrolase [Deltaproteobacteria bacterium]|nr:MBL fold metallo-hydrolase [Deltaproteobacteria bacterium]